MALNDIEKYSRLLEGNPYRAFLRPLLSGKALTHLEIKDALKHSLLDTAAAIEHLLQGGWLVEEVHRRSYYRIGCPDRLAAARNVLAISEKDLAIPPAATLSPLTYSRKCYKHPAGRVGWRLTEALQQKAYLIKHYRPGQYYFELTPSGQAFFESLGIEVEALKRGPKFMKACLDFSERKHHLGGALGRAFLLQMEALGWFCSFPDSRLTELTDLGLTELRKKLNLQL